jgi:hypothetical protein
LFVLAVEVLVLLDKHLPKLMAVVVVVAVLLI